MNKLTIKAIAVAICFAFSAGAMAQSMTKAEYTAGKSKITTEYKTAKTGCASLSGNANDICMAEAKGKEKVANAELEAAYKPSAKNTYNVSISKAEANYAVANERCDDKDGNVKDVCVKEAKAAQTTAKADAKAQMKATEANATANEKSADAQTKANNKSSEALKDAKSDKLDADYAVAKEKCDALAGSAKDSCLNQAKTRFGK